MKNLNDNRNVKFEGPGKAPLRTPIDPEQIRQRAYQIFVQRQGEPGNALEDWLEAEKELKLTNMPRS